MMIFYSLSEIKNTEPAVVALGNFDGIHRGHRALIETAVRQAKEKNVRSAVFTFQDHPRNVIAGSTVVRNIVYPDVKMELIRELGVDYVFSLPFDDYMMRQAPEEFVRDVMVGRFQAVGAVCGSNFTYGYKAGGNAEMLKEEGRHYGFDVMVVPMVTDHEDIVSSTLIRECIARGDVERAGELLGRCYSIRGTVVRGNQLGRTIGFPTCNISVDETMVTPPNGVYFTTCLLDGKQYSGITNVGNKPTVGNYSKNIEMNIFDFNQDVYGHTIEIFFLKKHRDEVKFSGLDELGKQLDRDREKARHYHCAVLETGRPGVIETAAEA